MAVMLRSGLTLLATLKTVAEYATRPAMRSVWENVAERIQQGASLADAMADHRCFGHMVVQLVRVGEQTGTLEKVVGRAADTMERRRLLVVHLLTALTYPAIVFVAAIGVAVFMMVGVIPKLRSFSRRPGPATAAHYPASAGRIRIRGDVRPHIVIGILAALAVVDHDIPVAARANVAGSADAAYAGGGPFAAAGGDCAILARPGRDPGKRHHSGRRVCGPWNCCTAIDMWRRQVGEARDAVITGQRLGRTAGRGFSLHADAVAHGGGRRVGGDIGRSAERSRPVSTKTNCKATIRRFSTLIEPAVVVVVGGIVGFVYIAFFVAMFSAAGGAQ